MSTPRSARGLDLALTVPGRLDVALRAVPGEVLAVIGPNGAGKTTLLHALAGLVPAAGHARLGEHDLLTRPVREREVGLVFQDQVLFPHLSALENVAFGLRARGTPRGRAREAAAAWLERVGLAELGGRRPGQLSGGQAQRVAIARALVTEPALLLLDEPMAGLDVGVAADLRVELRRHLADFDGVAVLVTHDALDALTLATRVVVLEGGRVAQEGPPEEVAARPRTEHVARLVGLNVVRREGRLAAFRPSDVTLSLEQPTGSARLVWHGPVRTLAPHGDAVRVQVAAHPDLIADVTPLAARDLALEPGTEVWLAVKATAVTSYADDGPAPH